MDPYGRGRDVRNALNGPGATPPPATAAADTLIPSRLRPATAPFPSEADVPMGQGGFSLLNEEKILVSANLGRIHRKLGAEV